MSRIGSAASERASRIPHAGRVIVALLVLHGTPGLGRAAVVGREDGDSGASLEAGIDGRAAMEFRAGLAAAEKGAWAEAIVHFEEARKIAPGYPPVWLNLGLAWAHTGRYVPAIAWLKTYLYAFPRAPQSKTVTKELDRLYSEAETQFKAIFKQALSVAGRIEDRDVKRMRLFHIARWQGFSCDIEGARKTWREDFALWEAFSPSEAGDIRIYFDSLMNADWVFCLAATGEVEKARATLQMVQRPSELFTALLAIAEAEAYLGDSSKALATVIEAEKLIEPIKEARAKENGEEEAGQDKASNFLDVAWTCAKAGFLSRARRIFAEASKVLEDRPALSSEELEEKYRKVHNAVYRHLPRGDFRPKTGLEEWEQLAVDLSANRVVAQTQERVEWALKDESVDGIANGLAAVGLKYAQSFQRIQALETRIRLGANLKPMGEQIDPASREAREALSAAHRVAEKIGIQWVRIPGGSFLMGSGDWDEAPAHRVIVKPFEIAKTEVTNKQYRACVEAGVCRPKDEYSGGADHPVFDVLDWKEAWRFSEWVGGRLPTEAEWEFAARNAGRDVNYPWGNDEADCARAVMDDGGIGCGHGSTWPVCSKSAGNTKQGLCDMAGNVAEWVQDSYHPSYVGAPVDGTAWESSTGTFRVFRGGSWKDSARDMRAASRYGEDPLREWDGLGFRPARDLR